MGRGMHLSLAPQERMDKLVSVSRTLSHSSTIICDTISRILNETVLEEEIICKICFNLLNDIDYHLKEAQVREFDIIYLSWFGYQIRRFRPGNEVIT